MNKVAIVTGAGSGIGRASRARPAEGRLAGRARRPPRRRARGDDAAPPATLAGNALAVPTDVTDPAAVKALFDGDASEAFGRLDLLFNNAGTGAPAIPLEDLTFEQWKSVVDINLTGVFLCTQAGLPADEEPDAARRPHHQQRLDLGARAAARSARPTPRPSTRSPA